MPASRVSSEGPWLDWTAFGVTLYAGLTMVTNVPFYSFKDVSFKRSVPFIVIVAIALGIAVISFHPPSVLFGMFVRLRPVGLRRLRLASQEGPAGERDRDLDRRARRAGAASLTAARVLHFSHELPPERRATTSWSDPGSLTFVSSFRLHGPHATRSGPFRFVARVANLATIAA